MIRRLWRFTLTLHAADRNTRGFPVGDPARVYVTDLRRTEDPRVVIRSQCPRTVLRVGHYDDYLGSSSPQQVWKVVPVAGHVDIAYFNVNTGAATCP